MTETRNVEMPDGTMTKIPSTILFRADEPDAVLCGRCGIWVRATRSDPNPWHGRYYWRWNYCPCMEAAVREASRQDEAQAQSETTLAAFERRQSDYRQFFPQWSQSRRVPTQTFGTLRTTTGNRQAVSESRRWIAEWPREGLLFHGATGTGKTHLIRAMGHEILTSHQTLLYTSVPFLLERLRPHSGIAMDDVLRLHITADVVIWDDVGAEKETEWTLDRLYLLLDARYEADKPLLATSNWSPEDLRQQWGSRITSRLFEMAPIWSIKGPDERIAMARRRARERGEA